MIEHLDTTRPAALMPGESCGGPCLACALNTAHATADDCIRYAGDRNAAGNRWYEDGPTNDPDYAVLLAADDAAWKVYHRMRRAHAGAAAIMKGTGNG